MIKEEISFLIVKGEIKDPRVRAVTITGVEMSEDLRMAKVYFTVHGGQEERKRAMEGLGRAAGFIKRTLGKRLRLKRVPDLSFTFDDSLEYGDRIEELLKRIREG